MMIPGISDRELWMLVMMCVVAMVASLINYWFTKVGFGEKTIWEILKCLKAKPIIVGAVAGLILWCLTGSGNYTPITREPLVHEMAIIMALAFGGASEKVVAVAINRGVPDWFFAVMKMPKK